MDRCPFSIMQGGDGTCYFNCLTMCKRRLKRKIGWGTDASTTTPGESFDEDAEAVFAAMATEPDATRKGHIDTFITSLKDASVWDLLDGLYITAAPAEADTLINWKAPGTNDLVESGTVTHSADAFMQGNGVDGLLTATDLAVSDAGFGYAQNSAHFGVFHNGEATNTRMVGINASTATRAWLIPNNTAGSAIAGVHCNTNTGNLALSDATGHYVVVRDAADATKVFENGVQLGSTDTDASVAEATDFFSLCGAHTGAALQYNTAKVLAGHFGPALTQPQVDAVSDALTTYLTAIGAYGA